MHVREQLPGGPGLMLVCRAVERVQEDRIGVHRGRKGPAIPSHRGRGLSARRPKLNCAVGVNDSFSCFSRLICDGSDRTNEAGYPWQRPLSENERPVSSITPKIRKYRDGRLRWTALRASWSARSSSRWP